MRTLPLTCVLLFLAAEPSVQAQEEDPTPAAEGPAEDEPAAKPPAASNPEEAESPPAPPPDENAAAKPAKKSKRKGKEARVPPHASEDAGSAAAMVAPAPLPERASTPVDAGQPSTLSTATASGGRGPLPGELEQALAVAKVFFTDLLAQDTEGVTTVCALPFQLEARRIASREELSQEWARQLHDKRTDLLSLYGIEMLTPKEMEKRYGKPPARLGSFPFQEPRTWIAIANVSGRAAVAVVRPAEKGFKVVAFTD